MADFDKVLIKDDRLVCSDKITYAVIKGAMNNTIVPYNAISGTSAPNPTSMTWNIQVPSEQIVIDRRVIVEADMVFEVVKTGVGGTISESVFNNGVDIGTDNAGLMAYGADCLNYLPFHQLVSTAQVTINNTSVSLNVQDVLPALIRFNDSRYINEVNGMTPIQPDKIGSYGLTTNSTTMVGGAGPAGLPIIRNDEASPFATYTTTTDEAFVPRGSFPVDCVTNLGGTAAAARVPVVGAASATQFIRVVVREPLMVSPFIWACPQENSQGIYGVQNLSVVLNLGAPLRCIRSRQQTEIASGASRSTVSIANFQINRCRLLMNYLTPQPSDLLVPRNVVPYQEFPRYFAQSAVSVGAGAQTGTTIVPAVAEATFNSIQLNQIPDKLIIYARPPPSAYNTTTKCTDHFLPIRSMTVNFNNQSGLLSTWTKAQFYQAARRCGSSQSWYEFSGTAQKDSGILSLQGLNGAAQATAFTNSSLTAPTTGSLCVLEFGTDIELPDYYAPGSLGNFNLQFQVTLENYGLSAIADYQLVVITMNSGVFVTEKGQSSVYTGILTKQDVLEASSMEPITGNAFKRMVGGSFWDSIKSIGSKVWRGIKSVLPYAAKAATLAAPALGPYGAPVAMGLNVASKMVGDGAAGAGMAGQGMGYGAAGAGRKKLAGYTV